MKTHKNEYSDSTQAPQKRVVVCSDFLARVFAFAQGMNDSHARVDLGHRTIEGVLRGPYACLIDTWAHENALQVPFRRRDEQHKLSLRLRQAYHQLRDTGYADVVHDPEPRIHFELESGFAHTLREHAYAGPQIYELLAEKLLKEERKRKR